MYVRTRGLACVELRGHGRVQCSAVVRRAGACFTIIARGRVLPLAACHTYLQLLPQYVVALQREFCDRMRVSILAQAIQP